MRRALALLVGITLLTGASLLVFRWTRSPQETPSGSQASLNVNAAKAAEGLAGVGSEGIQVHGNWVIEVREPDGTLANRVEFENAIDSGGAARLARVLIGTKSAGPWLVFLNGAAAASHPCVLSGNPFPCTIATAGSGVGPGPTVSNTLTMALVTGGFELKGTAIADRDGTIGSVQTANIECDPSIAPNSCGFTSGAGANYSSVTFKNLTTPVSVLSGQQVLVTVTITFSSP